MFHEAVEKGSRAMIPNFHKDWLRHDRLRDIVVRVPGYRSRDPGATIFSEK
jgi:hypothetical protein